MNNSEFYIIKMKTYDIIGIRRLQSRELYGIYKCFRILVRKSPINRI